MRILVVDDDPNVSGLVGTILEQLRLHGRVGRRCHRVHSRVIGGSLRPDLVVLDLMLPGTDGLEACRPDPRALGRSVAILMVSARGRAGVIDCLAAGADDYLAKPFDVGELEARVRTLLRARALEVAAIRRSERLLSLQRISAAIVARLDEDEILDLVLAEARRLFEASGVALFLWDAASKLLRPRRMSPPVQANPPLAAPVRRGAGGTGVRGARADAGSTTTARWSGGSRVGEAGRRGGRCRGAADARRARPSA